MLEELWWISSIKMICPLMTPDHVCLRIYNYGKDTEFFKIDWTQVFKHMRTVNFSFFSFGGRLFYESQMTFGARSSPDWWSWSYNLSALNNPPTHYCKADKMSGFCICQLFRLQLILKSNYIQLPIFEILRLLTIGDPVKTPSLRAWL